ncbi:hypothetical protein HAX54_025333 [Datura stramonium]|uniref:Uncharacterized protein n=1 Tax=Datura stramonium TaxID=4076 RepID=A0ABS8UZI8_DATST|nr:hypothetical protein [Datura stramonium]
MAAANYYSKDFEWDQLRQEIENNPSLAHHLLPFPNSATQNQDTLLSSPLSVCSPQEDTEAWNKFHTRHSTGKFFKCLLVPKEVWNLSLVNQGLMTENLDLRLDIGQLDS